MMRVAITVAPGFTAGRPEKLFESAEFVWNRPGNYAVLRDNKTFVMVRRSRVWGGEHRLRLVFDWSSELARLEPAK